MIDFSNQKPIIIDNPKFHLGESPVWWKERGLFIFTDILDKKICFFDPFTMETKLLNTSEAVVCVIPCNEKKILIANYNKICILDVESNKIKDFFVPKKKELGLRFNDGKCDSYGRLWISGVNNQKERINSSIFVLSSSLPLLIKERNNILLGNGLGWDHNQNKFYFTDSLRQKIFCYEFTTNPTKIIKKRTVFFHLEKKGLEPDGLYVDRHGFVWSCIWNGGQILRINPNGKIDFKIKLPVSRPTSIAFGGPNMDIMLVTTARPETQISEMKEPHSGKCFLYTSMPFGLPTQNFKL